MVESNNTMMFGGVERQRPPMNDKTAIFNQMKQKIHGDKRKVTKLTS